MLYYRQLIVLSAVQDYLFDKSKEILKKLIFKLFEREKNLYQH